VKSGIRIVLQFDVELEKTQRDEDESEGNYEATQEDQDEWEGNDEDEDESEGKDEGVWMNRIERQYSNRMEKGVDAQATDRATLEKVLAIIKKLLNNGAQEVSFALQHVYRKSSILGEYLKGSDATLYDALKASREYDVSLHPVIFREAFDVDIYENESSLIERSVYRWDALEDAKSSRFYDRLTPSLEFHIPELSGIQEISTEDHTGNEGMPSECRYFGGGMFVRPKRESRSSTYY